MGDDELNFTGEEARCWADDPHNQAHNDPVLLRAILTSLLVLIAFVILAFVASLRDSGPGPEQTHSGLLVVFAGRISMGRRNSHADERG